MPAAPHSTVLSADASATRRVACAPDAEIRNFGGCAFPGAALNSCRKKENAMTDSKALLALADTDDAAALLAALGDTPTYAVRSETGETVFLYSLYRGKMKCVEALQPRGGLALHEAAAGGDAARVDALIAAAPWTIQSLSADGWTALHLAAFLGRDAVVLRLLELGGDARQWGRAFEANLPIHAACAGRRIGKSAFAKLVNATGDPNVALKDGHTPLMIAAGNGFSDAVEVLHEAGAECSLKLADGKTAADFARERGHEELAKGIAP
jgi:ankyrin repeat protein